MSAPKSRREQLGLELEHLRRLAGLSGRALADMLPISQSTISQIERGLLRCAELEQRRSLIEVG